MNVRDEKSEITLQDATARAEAEVARRRASSAFLQGYEIEPVKMVSQDEETWKFCAVSKQAMDEGYVPGALYMHVDKRDGHIWTDEELIQRAERARQFARK